MQLYGAEPRNNGDSLDQVRRAGQEECWRPNSVNLRYTLLEQYEGLATRRRYIPVDIGRQKRRIDS